MTQQQTQTAERAATAPVEGLEPSRIPATLSQQPIVELPLEVRQQLELRRMMNQVASAIANLSWGKALDVPTRRAIAEYCHKYGVDPLTEVDILGGNLYINADYWKRRMGELRQQGIIADFRLDHIHRDERLEKIMNDTNAPAEYRRKATDEWYRTQFERARHNVPEQAAAACVCYIWLAVGGHPVEGCKWGGNDTSVMQPRSGGGSSPNPIVENNPELSVESQSIRRAMVMVASHLPAVLPNPEAMAADAKLLAASIDDAKARDAAIDAAQPKGFTPIPGTAADPYALDDTGAAVDGGLKNAFAAVGIDPVAVAEANQVSIQPAKPTDPDASVTDGDEDDRCPFCGWVDGEHEVGCVNAP